MLFDEKRLDDPPLLALRQSMMAMILVILVFAVFWNTLENGFAFDDTSMIQNNPAIRSIRYIWLYFTHPFFSIGQPVTGPVAYDYYRPMVLISYLSDYMIWGTSPAGYHLVNIILHSLVAILLFITLIRLGLNSVTSFFAAAFFAIHPVVADAVAGVSGRSDPLCGLFLLLAFYCYLVMRRKQGRTNFLLISLSLFFYIIALLTKENAIVFPLLITALEVIGPAGEGMGNFVDKLKKLTPVYAVSVLYLFWRSMLIPVSLQPSGGTELGQRTATAAVAASNYLFALFVPIHLSFETFTRIVPLLSVKSITAFIVIVAIITLAIMLRKKSAKASLMIAWFFISLLPFSYFFLFNHEEFVFTPPHFLYLPAMGLLAAAALAVEQYLRRLSRVSEQSLVFACIALLLFLLGALTAMRNREWRDDFTFFSSMVRRNPPSARIHIGLGNVLLSRGQSGYALARYAKGLELAQSTEQQPALVSDPKGARVGTIKIANPYAASALAGMGDVYFSINEAPAAVRMYESAARENAFDATVQFRLARAYEYIGHFDAALATYNRVLRLDKRFTDAGSSFQVVLTKQEVYDQAKRVYLTAHLSGQEDSADAYYGEAVMLRLAGRKAAAETLLREAVNKNPTHFGANLTLGEMLSERGLYEEAFGNFSLAFAVTPTSAVAAKEIALTSLILKDTLGAVQWAAKAYELAPEDSYRKFEQQVQRLAARIEQNHS